MEREILKKFDASQCDFNNIILQLDDNAIQKLIDKTDSLDLAVALKISGIRVFAKILYNMTDEKAENLLEDFDFMGPVPEHSAREMQQKIMTTLSVLIQKREVAMEQVEYKTLPFNAIQEKA